jgi:hypothetical protein
MLSLCTQIPAAPIQATEYESGWFNIYRMFSAHADWTLTHGSHKDTEQSTTEASVTLNGITLTDPLIR